MTDKLDFFYPSKKGFIPEKDCWNSPKLEHSKCESFGNIQTEAKKNKGERDMLLSTMCLINILFRELWFLGSTAYIRYSEKCINRFPR